MGNVRAKGEGSIYFEHSAACERDPREDGDCEGRWVAQVKQPRRMRRVRKTRAAAARALQELRREAGEPAAADRVTVGAWCDVWIAEIVGPRVRAGQLAAKTGRNYEADARLHIKPAIGHVRLDKLSPGHVARMMTAVQAKGLSATTAARARAALSAALSAAVADGLLQVNVARAARPPQGRQPDPSAFTDSEFDRIIGCCRDHRLGAMFVVAVLTGMRTSELIGLRWVDVDLEDGSYQVVEGLHRIGKTAAAALGIRPGLRRERPKSEASGRRTPLSELAVEILRRHRTEQLREQLAADRWVESGCVFTTPIGSPLDDSHVRREWRALLEAAEVPTKRPSGEGRQLHELRRTFATRLRDMGVPIEDVQKLGRWSTSTMLIRHYSAVDEARLRKAAGAADEGLHL